VLHDSWGAKVKEVFPLPDTLVAKTWLPTEVQWQLKAERPHWKRKTKRHIIKERDVKNEIITFLLCLICMFP